MIRFTCEKCGTAIQVPDEHAGKQGRCPGCKAVVTIPPPAAGEAPPAAAPAPPPPPAPEIISPPPAYGPGYARIPPPGPSKALAICAVFGCLGFIPLLGLTGIVLGAIALAGKKPGKGLALTGLILGLVLASGSTIASLYFLGKAREMARQATCLANLNTIGTGMQMYAVENDDRYPENFEALIKDGMIFEGCLKCPSTRSGRKCDYVYLKPERDAPPNTIAACERKGNHEDRRNILYVIGSVRGMTESEFQRELADPKNKAFAEHLREVEGQ